MSAAIPALSDLSCVLCWASFACPANFCFSVPRAHSALTATSSDGYIQRTPTLLESTVSTVSLHSLPAPSHQIRDRSLATMVYLHDTDDAGAPLIIKTLSTVSSCDTLVDAGQTYIEDGETRPSKAETWQSTTVSSKTSTSKSYLALLGALLLVFVFIAGVSVPAETLHIPSDSAVSHLELR